MTARLLRIAEAIAYLSTTVRAVRTLIWRRGIPFVPIGHAMGTVAITEDEMKLIEAEKIP